MLNFNEETRTYKLISLLSVVGEFPFSSLYLLGSKSHYQRLIRKMREKQEYRNSETGERISCKALTVSGKGKTKTLRLTKEAMPLVQWVGGAEYYCQTFLSNTFSGAKINVDRNHRVAETVAMMQRVDIEYRPWELPYLQDATRQYWTIEEASYYLSRYIKRECNLQSDKYTNSRVVGAMMTPHESFVVYNARDNIMKWAGLGESKMHSHIQNYAALNTRNGSLTKSIIMGKSLEAIIEMIEPTDVYSMKNGSYKRRNTKYNVSPLTIYESIHYVPLNEFGSKLLQILTLPDFHSELLDLVYEEDELSDKHDSFVYDAYQNERFILSFLDADVIRLWRFKQGIEWGKQLGRELHYAVLCFPEQEDELREYLGDEINYQTLNIDAVLNNLPLDY